MDAIHGEICPKFIHSLDIRRNHHREENPLTSQDELLSRIILGAFVDEGNENVCLLAEHQVGQVGYRLER